MLLEDVLPEMRKGRKAKREGYIYYIRSNGIFRAKGGQEEMLCTGFGSEDLVSSNWELVPIPVKHSACVFLWSDGVVTTEPLRVGSPYGYSPIKAEFRVIEWEVTK